MSPLDADTEEVESHFLPHLPPLPASVLEVGAGDGRLAARLAARGYSVKAIDVDDEAVAAAIARGVAAARVDYFDMRGQFDVLLFTRSFHHLWPLEKAVVQAGRLLAPGGALLFDEFAHEACDLATAAWFYDVPALLDAAGVLAPEKRRHWHRPHHDRGHTEEESKAPLERWRERIAHDPPLHRGDSMLEALGAAFAVEAVERVPYLYRYLAERLDSAALFMRIGAIEAERIALGLLVPIGLRVAARGR
jgi:SAM-dependent methyltransferase